MRLIKTKILFLILTLAVSLTMLFSCEFPGMGATTQTPDETKTYSRIVRVDTELDLIGVRNALSKITGNIPGIVQDNEAAIDGEIVFGDTNRQVTALAKAALEDELAKVDSSEVGYIVYSDGKNIAIYWNDEEMGELAVSKFISEFLSGSKIEVKDGIAFTQLYTAADFEREKAWDLIETQVDSELYDTLRELISFYDGSYMVEWFANLWDDDIGAFYFSNSARDNYPFLPDMESTWQLLDTLRGQGATGGLSLDEFLPNEMKAKVVAFAKELQDPSDGYFYHPQWPKETISNLHRYNRDTRYAEMAITQLTVDADGDGIGEKQYPYYCTPSGYKCEIHDGTDEMCDFSKSTVSASYTDTSSSGISSAAKAGMTVSLRENVVGAVYRVRRESGSSIAAVAVSNKPDFSSPEAFKQWFWDFSGGMDGFRESSGRAADFGTMRQMIMNRGFGKYVAEILFEVQETIYQEQLESGETPSGLWQEEANIQGSMSLQKYMPLINSGSINMALDIDIAKCMMKSCLDVLGTPIDEHYVDGVWYEPAMNDVMNMWNAISYIISNVKMHYSDEVLEEFYADVRAVALPVLENSIETLKHYYIDNGLFVFYYSRLSPTKMYGSPTSLGVLESDVNCMCMAMGVYGSVFNSLGLKKVPYCTAADGENFLRIVDGLETVTKNPLPTPVTYDFEDDDLSCINGSVNDSGSLYYGIEADPTNGSNYALHYTSRGHDTVKFNAFTSTGNCYIFETKMLFNDTFTTSGTPSAAKGVFQIQIGELYMLSAGLVGDKIYFGYMTHNKEAGRYVDEDLITVDNDGWVKIRLEIYTADSTDDGTVKVKYFINDKYVLTDNHYWLMHRGTSLSTFFTTVNFFVRSNFVTDVYIDDCYFSNETKIYDGEYHDISDSRK